MISFTDLFKLSATLLVCVVMLAVPVSYANSVQKLFEAEGLQSSDAVLLVEILANESMGSENRRQEHKQQTLYQWRAEQPLIPASLAKLATSYLAIEKWGLDKRFSTDFYRDKETLWVKGFGDPYLVSEELDLIANQLLQSDMSWVRAIAIDNTFFKDDVVPGRSGVADPYNAPLAAVSANFNTVKLKNVGGKLYSAEPQTPLTEIAVKVAKKLGRPTSGKTERVNLVNADNAAQHFAQILATKLNLQKVISRSYSISVKAMPADAVLVYKHINSHTLAEIIRGTLEYSNNFMANQLFLMLPSRAQTSFENASLLAEEQLRNDYNWPTLSLVEGAGLSRQNRLSAIQLNQLLKSLANVRHLFKSYDLGVDGVKVWAKTGTLSGVRSYAGYIEINQRQFQFVFNFNRKVPYKYRETLLTKLVKVLLEE